MAMLDDLRWLGLDWDEGPDVGGPSAPYVQSERRASYEAALDRLKAAERVYPCTCTRADIERAASAPHPEDEGPELSRDLLAPHARRTPTAWAIDRSPGDSACPGADRLG